MELPSDPVFSQRLRASGVAVLSLLLSVSGCASSLSTPVTSPSPAGSPQLSATLDADALRWVENSLADLSLREKVAQLVMPWVGGDFTPHDSPEFDRLREWVEEDGVGGLIISVGMPHSYAAKINELQRLAVHPLLITSDMENGAGMRMAGIYSLPHLLPQGGGTVFPPVMALGATGSDSLAYELGRIMGIEARAVGVHMTFGPVLDVNSNPANPIINTRSFGEDPVLVSRLAGAYIRGARDSGLMTTGKHFPGHGDTFEDSHIALPTISADRVRLDAVELPPFRSAIADGVDAIMTAHITVVGVEGPDARPATLSPYFMTAVLREEMGFDGLLFTDAMTMAGVAQRYGATEPLIMAMEAGADVLLMPRDVRTAIQTIVAAVESGRLSEARIDQSVRRLFLAKARAGLVGNRQVQLEQVSEIVGVRPHTTVATTIAERSITLVRDRETSVPLAPGVGRVLSITYARPSDLVAGRAFDSALERGGVRVTSVRVDHRTSEAELLELRSRVDSADLVVASAYVAPLIDGESTIGTGARFSALVEEVAASGKPVVAVSFGSPYLLSSFPSVPAYLLAWGGAEISQRAAARALLGQIPIGGRLPVALPPHHPVGSGLQRSARAGIER
jgi:beta-N-acetylhexosaminidase